MQTRALRRPWLILGLVALCALPAMANHIDQSTVTADCTGFTINAKGSELILDPRTYVYKVTYRIVLTPTSGPDIIVDGEYFVTPTEAGVFDASQTQTWASLGVSLNGAFTLSGAASLVRNQFLRNTVPIVFTPSTLTCGMPSCTGKIGNLVWNDLNRNGVQDASEPGIAGVTVELWDSTQMTMLQSTMTNSSGLYLFEVLCANTYKVVVPAQPPLSGFVASPALQGGDPAKDSNNSPHTVVLPANDSSDLTVDFGYNTPAARLTLVKSPKGGTFSQGSQVSFTMVVGNSGGSMATNVRLTDQLPGNGGLQWASHTTTQGTCTLVANFLDCNLGSLGVGGSATVKVFSTSSTPSGACQLQPNPVARATADGGLQVTDDGDLSCTPPPLPCPAGSFTYSFDMAGNLNIVFDQFPAPNDNSYGVNAVGWGNKQHKFNMLTGSDHAGFQLRDGSGAIRLNFNVDYLSRDSTRPSGYGSLGVNGGDGGMLAGTASGITATTSLDRNLNNVNIPGLFSAGHIQQFGSVNVLENSPPTDAAHQTYNNSDPALGGWDFHNTYFVTISAAKLASIGFNPATWKVEPNPDALHNSPAKACPPPASTGQGLTITKKEIKDKQVKITLLNSTQTDQFVSAVQVTWPAINGKLSQIKVGGDTIHDKPDIAPTSVTLTTSQLTTDMNKRKIKAGDDEVFTLIFEKNADPTFANYTGTVSTNGFTLTILP